MNEKIDPHNKKLTYENWKANGMNIKDISDRNSKIIVQYVLDMEQGINISQGGKKGRRSYTRLITIRNRMKRISELLKKYLNVDDITKVSEEQITKLFNDMREGKILSVSGKPFMSVRDYVETFKSFWNWRVRTNNKKGVEILNLSQDLDLSRDKPKWVYLNEEQFRQLCDNAKYEYKVLITFLWDSGIRSPTELVNVRVSDLEEISGIYLLNIREETSKTFGRKIKLLVCSRLLKEFINRKGLKGNDQIFKICPRVTNQYLSRLGKKVLGDGVSKAGEYYSKLTMYDFRHCSCCYWLPRYKSESALKYRFGWKKGDKIHYYSEMLGMKDTITEQDLMVDVTASEIERQLIREKQERELLEEKFDSLIQQRQEDFSKFMSIIKKMNLLQKQIKKLNKN